MKYEQRNAEKCNDEPMQFGQELANFAVHTI